MTETWWLLQTMTPKLQRNLVWAGNAARENRYLYVKCDVMSNLGGTAKKSFRPNIGGGKALFSIR